MNICAQTGQGVVVGVVSLRKGSHRTRCCMNNVTSIFRLSVNSFCFTHVFYRSSYEEPSCDEGFEGIVKVNFRPRFKDEKIKELYLQFL